MDLSKLITCCSPDIQKTFGDLRRNIGKERTQLIGLVHHGLGVSNHVLSQQIHIMGLVSNLTYQGIQLQSKFAGWIRGTDLGFFGFLLAIFPPVSDIIAPRTVSVNLLQVHHDIPRLITFHIVVTMPTGPLIEDGESADRERACCSVTI